MSKLRLATLTTCSRSSMEDFFSARYNYKIEKFKNVSKQQNILNDYTVAAVIQVPWIYWILLEFCPEAAQQMSESIGKFDVFCLVGLPCLYWF